MHGDSSVSRDDSYASLGDLLSSHDDSVASARNSYASRGDAHEVHDGLRANSHDSYETRRVPYVAFGDPYGKFRALEGRLVLPLQKSWVFFVSLINEPDQRNFVNPV